MAKNRPSILDIAPAVQDKTRVGGLMEDIEVPAGEFADFDLMKEHLIEMGMPPGLVNDYMEKAKEDPGSQKKKENIIMKLLQEDPSLLEGLKNLPIFGNPEDEDQYDIDTDALYGTGR